MPPLIGISVATLVLENLPRIPSDAVSRHYVDGVVQAGGRPLLLPNVDAAEAGPYLERLDGVLLTGGCDVSPDRYGQEAHSQLGPVDPVRDRFEGALARVAHERGLPIFAICRGAQVLNVALGGSLLQHVPFHVGEDVAHDQGIGNWYTLAHEVVVVPGTRLRELAGTDRLEVNSFHHQAVDRVGDGLVVTAHALDGVVEGLEAPEHPFCVAVQWHPERRLDDAISRALFGSFVEAARSTARV